ncbi:MAG: type 4a pilus biogenesis protein PilO [Candidatus Sericytochromatia bacterium]
MQLDTSTTITISGQEIPAIYIAIGLPVLALGYTLMQLYMGDYPLMGRLEALEGREAGLAGLEAEAQELKRQASAVDETKEEIAKREEQITLLKQQIPSDAQVSVLLFDIERMTKQSQGSLFSFTPGALRAFGSNGQDSGGSPGGSATSDIQELPVTIKATATYPEVIDFLSLLNSYERKLNVSNLTLAPAGSAGVQQPGEDGKAAGFKNTLNVEFTLLAYVLISNGAQP